MYKKYFSKLCLAMLVSFCGKQLASQPIKTTPVKLEPPFWFSEMGSDTLQILVRGDRMNEVKVEINSTNAKLLQVKGLGQNYALCKLKIDQNFVGKIPFYFQHEGVRQRVNYKIKKKPTGMLEAKASDAMYLIMPDRFNNADSTNDLAADLLEKPNRNDPFGRHGGDIKGIDDQLGYIQSLGFNSLWLTPVWENNQADQSYHGYACTDHYRIDPRFGTLEEYQNMCYKAEKMGIKMYIDMVYNHIGSEHPFFKDPIDTSWFHTHGNFKQTNFRLSTNMDPYASQKDKELAEKGWFVKVMPDLNQSNPEVSLYLIQNTLWWIATARLSGVRVDTYPYSEAGFLEKLNRRVKQVFPHAFIFGECWDYTIPSLVYYAPNKLDQDVSGKPQSITDFSVSFALQEGLNEEGNWRQGLTKLYYALVGDYLYQDPKRLVTFIDNHDIERMHGIYKEDKKVTTMALGLLLMTRGIPCVFYGTEVWMKETKSHGVIREEMPGGWADHDSSIFDIALSKQTQPELIQFLRKVNALRNQYSNHFEVGKRIQLVPSDGVYSAGIWHENTAIIYIANQGDKSVNIDFQRFDDWGLEGQDAEKIVGLGTVSEKQFHIEPKDFSIWVFKKPNQ